MIISPLRICLNLPQPSWCNLHKQSKPMYDNDTTIIILSISILLLFLKMDKMKGQLIKEKSKMIKPCTTRIYINVRNQRQREVT